MDYAHPEIPKFIVDPNTKEVPNGFIHIRDNATKGVDRLIEELMKLKIIKATYLNNGISCLYYYLVFFFMGETPFFGVVVGNPMRFPKYFLKSKFFIAIKI